MLRVSCRSSFGAPSASTPRLHRPPRILFAALTILAWVALAAPQVKAGITLVQHTSKDAGITSSSSLAFPATNTAGNWIGVVIRGGHSGQVFTVSDSRGNTYKPAVQFNQTLDAPNGETLAIFYAESIAGGANTVTVAESIANNTLRFAILEYSGVATSGSIDVTAAAQGSGTTWNSGTATTTVGGDLILGEVTTGDGVTFTAGSGYTIEERAPASPNTKVIAEDAIQAVAGAVSAGATVSSSSNGGALLAAFKAAGGTGGTPATMTANAGTTPQSATVSIAFASALAVTVKDASSNPVSGVNVTFTAPGSGASGTFSNSTATITVATNASGVASAPFTANATAGGPYTVTAGASGLTTVNFSLTNTVGSPSTMTANAGTTPQSATISTAFANALAVTVKDAGSNPVSGVNVTFTAPGSGASGTFSNSTATITVATNASGIASAAFTANATAGGPYTVTATATGVTAVNFSLTNTAGAPSTMTANSGTTPQSSAISTAFTNALAVTVKDASSNPVSGVNVTFTAPGSGPSGTFSNSTATITVATNASGVASAPFTANATAGGPYTVTAGASGLTTVNFSLTNTVGSPSTMTANAGTTPQSAAISTAYANALAVTVKDAGSNPVSGVNVTFTAPGSGASGTFSNSTATITVATNASGIASAAFTGNATAGGPYAVSAAASGLTTLNFSLTNTAGAPSTMTANAGTTPQSSAISTAFANALAVTVKDASSNPVSGVNVTFTAPASGASGIFSNSTATITVATNASGVASALFTANGTAGGPYAVSAAATGLTTVNFSLTNLAGTPTSMTANAGTTPQSATISTAFTNALAVTVKDASSNPVSGVNVTFTAPGSGASGTFSNSAAAITVATDASGIASAAFTANTTAGGPYMVTATAAALTTANFSLTNTAGAPSTMTANAGTTPQSTAISTAFASALAVTVKDAGSNPVSGVNVTFTAPGSGASGTFSNSTATITVATNASGVASSPFTANATTGGPYTVTAAATGLTTVNFSLTNTAGAPSTMTANAGTTPQSATVSTAFANALAVTVKDASSNPVSGVNVTFTAPGSGASGTFSNSTVTITVATNSSGVASAPFTANTTAGGPYTVTAAATGLTTVNFSLTNTVGAPSTMTANAGTTPQSATISTAFANALAVTVKDASSNPVSGVNVTFTAPGSGASGVFSNSTATITVATNASGVASAPFTANTTAGGPYTVTAAATGLTTVNFSLTNTAGAPSTMTANAGTTPQSATISTAFANALAVTVKDASSNPVSGVNVTFTAPGSGASGTFSNSTATITVATNASGVASAPFTANATTGGPYTVTAAATGLTTVNFSLTNTVGAPSTMTANAGTTPQSATISTAFANALAVTVKDASSNPVSGVNVTFTAPGSGASGTFSNSTATITVATNASGIASASFTANATTGGPYTVTAAATGLTTVNFSLTNTAGAPSTMTANSGTTPQSATVSTAFATALAVIVKDASSNPVSGVNVTFTAPGSGASGTFSNSTATITVATNASGVASAPFTANATTGGPYTVTAAATGLTTVNFSLTNTAVVAIAFVQSNSADPQSPQTSVAVPFTAAQKAGDLNVIVVGWNDSTAAVSSVVDSKGNNYAVAAPAVVQSGVATQAIYYAKNIMAAAAGGNTVTITFSAPAAFPDIRIAEYSGIDTQNPVDVFAGAQGSTTSSDSGTVATTNANDLLVGANLVQTLTTGAGTGFTRRVITSPDGDILEDRVVTATGSYNATAPVSPSGAWIMQMVAFRAAGGTGGLTPTITSLSTASAPVGTAVTITGTNFGGAQGSSSVTFNGTPAGTATSWNATTIVIPVPAAATTGNVVVTVGGAASNGVGFTVSPNITNVNPTSGTIGTPVTLTGTTFGSSVGGVTFNGIAATPSSWTPTSIGVAVPNGASTGNIVVTASGVQSNAVAFTVNNPGPSLSTLGLTQGPVGAVITITGVNFGTTTSTVTFGATTANIKTWSATSIDAYVPSMGLGTVNVVVTVNGVASNGLPFTVTPPPNISSINPVSGPIGTSVTVNGMNFGPTVGTRVSILSFNGVAARTTSWSDTQIVAPAPAGATTGNVVVSISGVLSNGVLFTVTNPPASITATAGTPQSATISTAFGTQLQATVKDSSSNPVSGATVTFTAPTSGASGTFAGGVNTATTNASGVATSAIFTANTTAGTYNVVASVSGVSGGANFALTNLAGPAAIVKATSGTPQSALVSTAFAAPLVATVTDASNNPVSGVTVTFTPPTSGASGTFAGGVNTATTNASGAATSATFTANSNAGTYNVVASATGATSANFSLTNLSSAAAIAFVQSNSTDPQGGQTTVTVPFSAAQTAGNLNVVVVGWNDSTATVSSVMDTKGNAYLLVIGPTVQSGIASQSIYAAKNIVAAAAGANTVTVTFATAANAPDIRIAEYSGVDPANPFDGAVGAQGSTTSSDSGTVATTNANDLLVGANLVQTVTTGAGTGFTSRVITSPDGDILEDRVVTAAGSYNATAPVSPSGNWIMQMVAFRAAGSGPPPPISVSVAPTTANVASGGGTQSFTATLVNDVSNLGVTWSASGTGCSGVACGTFTSVTKTTATYNAPASVPNPATVTVKATSVADNTKSASATVTVTQGVITVTLSPKRGSITTSQTQQFTATVFNDSSNAGVTWQVDGNTGGNSSTGIISTSGLFTPGTVPGLHNITATSVANASASATVSFAVTDLQGVYTYHNDVQRTGQNLKEYALTPANVNSSTFTQLFTCNVDGQVYAQPLYAANLTVGGVKHNVVYIATEHDSVYAFDADSASCVQLWKTSFLGTNVTTMPWNDTPPGTNDVYPEIGITSTPVIDPTTNTMYVVAKTKETAGNVSGQACSSGSPCYPSRLHALDITTGAEKSGGPVVIAAPNFDSLHHFNRPALLLVNSTVYVAFGSHGDGCPWQGWLFGYDPASLTQKFVWSTSDPTSGCNGAAIWDGGAGPAADASGSVYVVTGNGSYDGVKNFSETTAKLNPTGTLLDWFTPFNTSTLDANDIDMGSSGAIILPSSVGSTAHPNLLVTTGKIAILYLLDITTGTGHSMGKFNSSTNNDVQEVIPVPPPNTTQLDGGNYGVPAYWNGNIYTTGQNFPLSQFTIANGVIATPQAAKSSNTYPPRGAVPAVSANGNTNGIVWVLDLSGWTSSGVGNAILYAYDATNVANVLYVSPSSGSGAAPGAVKFTLAVVANGKVYVAGAGGFSVFGLLPN